MAIIVFGESSRGFRLRQYFGVLIIWSAFTAPFLCLDRRPIDLARAFYAREDVTFDQTGCRQIYDDVIALQRKEKGRWFLIAGGGSCVLSFLTLKEAPWILTPRWEQIFKYPDAGKAAQMFVLVMNMPIPAGLPLEIIKQYPFDCYVLRVTRELSAADPLRDCSPAGCSTATTASESLSFTSFAERDSWPRPSSSTGPQNSIRLALAAPGNWKRASVDWYRASRDRSYEPSRSYRASRGRQIIVSLSRDSLTACAVAAG